MSSEIISATKIGKTLNRFVKDAALDPPLQKRTELLVQQWKDIVNREKKKNAPQLGKRLQPETPAPEPE